MEKKKIYQLRVAKKFMTDHFRVGEETGFVEKILKKQKIHTLRENWQYWYAVAKEVNAGKAELHVKYWTGRPFHSSQETFMVLDKIGIELALVDLRGSVVEILTYEPESEHCAFHHHGYQELPFIANNDGLVTEDFREWFKNASVDYKAIIHFTDFRYANHG